MAVPPRLPRPRPSSLLALSFPVKIFFTPLITHISFTVLEQIYWAPDSIWSSNSEGAWGTLGRLTTLMNPAGEEGVGFQQSQRGVGAVKGS